MSGNPTYTFPGEAELLREVKAHGSVAQYAIALGCNESTLRRYLQRSNLLEKARAATQKPVKAEKPVKRPTGPQTKHNYPPAAELVAGAIEAGSITAYARVFGISDRTLHNHLERIGVIDQVRKGLKGPALQAKAPKLGDEVSREEILEQENRELRANAKRGRKDEIAEERVLQSVQKSLATVPPPTRVGPAVVRPPGSKEPHHRQLVALSDWHGGEIVDPLQVNGLNAYSWEIMEARVEELIAGLLSHKANSPALTGLDIALIGDMTSGHQHEELAETNEYPLAEQGVRMGHLIGTTVERLQPHYLDVRVVSVPGNHPRLKQKPAAKRVNDNFDWVSAMIAKEYLSKFSNIQMTVSTGGAMLHRFAGNTFYIWHGDGIKSTMPGVPWGGVMRRINDIRRGFAGTQIDCWLLGHFHQCNVMKSLGIFMNGSLKGTDEWVIKNFGGGSDPEQLLLTFSEKRRRMTDARFLTPRAGLPGRTV